MFAIVLVPLIAIANFALGFALAVHLGHGPSWAGLPNSDEVRNMLLSLFRRRRRARTRA